MGRPEEKKRAVEVDPEKERARGGQNGGDLRPGAIAEAGNRETRRGNLERGVNGPFWNQYEPRITDSHRNSNISEAWHTQFRNRLNLF